MFEFKRGLFSVIGAALLALPVAANAATLRVTDIDSGDRKVVRGAGTLSYSGVIGGITADAISGTVSRTADKYALDTSSVLSSGTGSLKIAFMAGGFTDFGSLKTSLFEHTTIADSAFRAKVRHFINIGSGWTDIKTVKPVAGSTEFGFAAEDVTTGSGTFKLMTVIRLTTGSDETSDISASLVAAPTPVPLPAAGLLLVGALGGMGLVARRRRRS